MLMLPTSRSISAITNPVLMLFQPSRFDENFLHDSLLHRNGQPDGTPK